MRNFFLFILFFRIAFVAHAQVIADFSIPDTVFVGQKFSIVNLSVGNTSNDWNLNSGNLYNSPVAVNINIGSYDPYKIPTRICLAQDSNRYYAFISNHHDSSISRLTFKGSYMDEHPEVHHFTPAELNNNIVTPQGIQVAYDSVAEKWFGLVINNNSWSIGDGSIALIDFGTSLDNNSPTVTIIDRVIGHIAFGEACHLVNDQDGNWFLFVANQRTFVSGLPVSDQLPFVSRYAFGNTLANAPVWTKLDTKPTMLGTNTISENYCVKVFQDDVGDWYGLVLNSNSSFSRIYFGNNLNNKPIGERFSSIPNIGGAYEFQVLEDDNRYFVPTITQTVKGLTMVGFDSIRSNKPYSIPIANGFSSPHGLSEIYQMGDTLISFVINTTAELTRMIFPGSSLKNQMLKSDMNLNDISYSQAGIYKIRLTINKGTPNEQSKSKFITVIDSVKVNTLATIKNANINLYPNPTSDVVTLEGIPFHSFVKICDHKGQLVLATKNENNATLRIDVSHFASGIYHVELQSTKGSSYLSFIKK